MINIRLLTEEDIIKYKKKLEFLLKMNLEENFPGAVTDEIVQKYVENMQIFVRDGSAIIVAGFDQDNLIGFDWGYEKKQFNERRLHSNFVVIELAYRKQKLGSKFFEFLKEEAVKRGIHAIEAMCNESNSIAMSYYKRNGFEVESHKVCKRF